MHWVLVATPGIFDLLCRHVGSFSFSMWDLYFFCYTCRIFSCSMQSLSYSMWDLVPQSGIESRPSVLGVQNLSHWTTREVPSHCCFNLHSQDNMVHLFIHLFFICMSSLLRPFKIFGPFFNWVVFLLLSFNNFYIIWVTVLCWMYILKIFSYTPWLAF